jgi:hypothetical protein
MRKTSIEMKLLVEIKVLVEMEVQAMRKGDEMIR